VRAERPEVYVRTAITREAVSWRRRLARRPVERPLPPEDGGEREVDGGQRGTAGEAAGRDGSEGRALRALLWAEVQHLPPRMRAVVVLRVWEDLSEAEVASVLGCSTGSVKSQLSRGLARLRDRAGLREAVGLAPGAGEGRTA
jgi:RNA polymerase sigma factor (sigma-70 family)